MKELENKVIVITGGSAGIGISTALAFAEKGAKVVIVLDALTRLVLTNAMQFISKPHGTSHLNLGAFSS